MHFTGRLKAALRQNPSRGGRDGSLSKGPDESSAVQQHHYYVGAIEKPRMCVERLGTTCPGASFRIFQRIGRSER